MTSGLNGTAHIDMLPASRDTQALPKLNEGQAAFREGLTTAKDLSMVSPESWNPVQRAEAPATLHTVPFVTGSLLSGGPLSLLLKLLDLMRMLTSLIPMHEKGVNKSPIRSMMSVSG